MQKVKTTLNIVSKIQDVPHTLPLDFYCKAMANILFDSFSIEFIQISSFTNNELKLLKYMDKGEERHGTMFSMLDNPSEVIIKECNPLVINDDFFQVFPKASLTNASSLKSYIGYPIIGPNEENLGVVELYDTRKIKDSLLICEFLPIISKAISNHIERETSFRSINETNQYLAKLLAEKSREVITLRSQELEQERLASLGRVIGGISHEMRNPLDYVLDQANKSVLFAKGFKKELCKYSDELDSQTKDNLLTSFNELYESLIIINTHSNRLFNISSVLLEQTSVKSSFANFDLHDLLAENLKFAYHSSQLRKNNLTFNSTIDIPNSLKKVVLTTDVSSLFLNLFDNAFDSIYEDIKKHPDKPATVDIKVIHNVNEFEISIKDNGIGMDQNVMSHIQEPFYTTKPNGEGTGIGLTIVKEILAKNSGMMKLESVPHEYTRFELHFPYMQAV
jgi:signal transduction histidine kinase